MDEKEKLSRVAAKEFLYTSDFTNSKLAVIDFETTGLDPVKDRIIEIGIAEFDGGCLTACSNYFVNPGILLTEEVTKIHGITNDNLKEARSFSELVPLIASCLRNRIPVAYNADFDRSFLHAELDRLRRKDCLLIYEHIPAFDISVEWLDPLIWVRHLYKYAKSKKLTDMCKNLGIELTNAHRAASDASATGNLMFKLASSLPEKDYSKLIKWQIDLSVQQDRDYQAWKSRQK